MDRPFVVVVRKSMAWGKDNNNEQLIRAQVELEMLRKQNEQLSKQVEKLQDALVASSSPKAYDAMQREKEFSLPETKEEMEQRLKNLKEAAYLSSYLEEMEKPLFDDANDMVELLQAGILKTSMADRGPLVPGNNES